jgi:U3 small nucleolar RNA-associated protein 19
MEKFVKTLEASVSADRTVIENNEAESDSKERLVSVNV